MKLDSIGKSFGAVRVLEGVSLDLRPGEVHVLAGENGAGKSTLIKILAGVHAEHEGRIELPAGRPVRFRRPVEAARQGIAVIHQEMSLVGPMSVFDNLFLGREGIPKSERRRRALEACAEVGLAQDAGFDLDRAVEEFPLLARNLIEIAKALLLDARVLVMDEPTSALTRAEVERLYAMIGRLTARGVGVIYISHKMEEIYRLADRITVLRDGRWVATREASELPEPELVKLMVGRELSQQIQRRARATGPESLRVENLSIPGASGGVSFSVRAGEIVGLAGLQGSGNSEVLRAIFCGAPEGRVFVDGRALSRRSPSRSIAAGVAYLTNDRKGTGLVLGMPVAQNVTLASVPCFSRGGWLRAKREAARAREYQKALRIRLSSVEQEVRTLSGGNQQKVVLAKWLETRPRVLLLDEPTRGVDVGAKHEIYELMNEWTAQGMAIVLISTEMPELLGLSDRVLVMHRGRISAEIEGRHATQEGVLRVAMGREMGQVAAC